MNRVPIGVEGYDYWNLEIVDLRRQMRLPAKLPAVVTEQAIKEEGNRIMYVMLEALQWSKLP
jgi:hypothetical protein